MGCLMSGAYAQRVGLPDTTGLKKQKDLIDALSALFKLDQAKNDCVRVEKKFQFSLIPVAGNVAGGGKAVATAFNAAFYTSDEAATSLSTVSFSPWFTFEGKFVLPFRNNVWLPGDILLWKGDTRFMVYPQYTWGIGGNTNSDEKMLLEYNYLRFYHSFLMKMGKKIFLGAGYNLDFHFNTLPENDSTHFSTVPFYDYENEYRKKTVSSGTVINFLIDSRRNSINPPGGVYLSIDYRLNMKILGSTSDWQSLFIDFRKYFSFDKSQQNILAFWTYYWDITSGKAPYLDLPSIGWDSYSRSGRGFQQNRYRGKSLFYMESEYRRDITRNGLWGFVIFANLHSVPEYEDKQFVYWHPAAGAGLRLKFNKISRTNIGLDCGISKNYTGIYLILGEAF
jgi:hypothetical protein